MQRYERVLDLKYYSLDLVTVLSVPSVVQKFWTLFCICTVETWIEIKRNNKAALGD